MAYDKKTTDAINRRQFVKGMIATGAFSMMTPSLLSTAFASTSGTTGEVLTGAHWGIIQAKVKNGKFVTALPFVKDRFPTSLVKHTPEYVYSPTRVKYPMVRKDFLKNGHRSDTSQRGNGEFVRVSWEKAYELVASELKRVKKQHGPAAIYGGNPGWRNVGKLQNSSAALGRLLNLHGGCTKASGDYSTGASQLLMGHVMGNMEVYSQQTTWPTVMEHSDLVVMWGADPLSTLKMGWVMPDHGGNEGMEALKKSGKKVIIIDPLRSDTADYLNADWIAPKPGSDVAMMLGVAHTMVTQNMVDLDFLDEYTVGFDKVKAYLLGKEDGQAKTAAWASKICGVKESRIKKLAKQMTAGRTMLMSGWSMQRADHGEQAHWGIVTLASLIGQIGLPGGGFGLAYHYASAGSPAANGAVMPGFGSGKAPKNMPPTIPVARISDALLNPGKVIDYNGKKVTYPDIKLVYWAGGNPFHHQQDTNKLIKAWRKPETVIVNEMFWTATAKFADIVLPTTTSFEQDDIEHGGDYSGRFIIPMHKVIDPLFEAKPNYEIFSGIADKLGFKKAFTEGKSEMDWIRGFYNVALKQAKSKKIKMPGFNEFWKSGSYVEFKVPQSAQQWIRHADFREDPLLEPLGTPSGKIELYSKTIEKMKYDDCPPHVTWIEPAEWLGSTKAKKYPLHMLSPHPKDRLHSQMNHVRSLRKKYTVNDREPVWISAVDAKKRGIKNGDLVRLFNDRGEVLAGAYVTDRLLPGVVRLREGAWYDPSAPGKTSTMCKNGHPNVLTIDKGSSKLAQATIANTALVEVERYRKSAPSLTAFNPAKGG